MRPCAVVGIVRSCRSVREVAPPPKSPRLDGCSSRLYYVAVGACIVLFGRTRTATRALLNDEPCSTRQPCIFIYVFVFVCFPSIHRRIYVSHQGIWGLFASALTPIPHRPILYQAPLQASRVPPRPQEKKETPELLPAPLPSSMLPSIPSGPSVFVPKLLR